MSSTAAAPSVVANVKPVWYRDPVLLTISSLTAACLVIYSRSLWFDFINLDDDVYVVDNSAIHGGLTLASIKWAFSAFYGANWHPLTWLSHALDIQFFGLNAGGHHAVNVVLHVANSALLFIVVRLLTGRLWESAAVAAIFAVHPAHVESVAWVAERKDVLSTLFWLLSTLFYVRYIRAAETKKYYFISLALFAIGLAAKPMLVTMPFTLLLLDFWPLRRFDRWTREELLPLVREKLPFFALSAVSSVITVLAQSAGGAIQSSATIGLSERLLNAVASFAKYVLMMFYPTGLGVWYPFEGNFGVGVVLGSILVIACISVLSIARIREQRYLFVGWFWFLGTLVPVIGILQVGRQAMADRYTYVPYIGLSIAIVWLASDILRRFKLPAYTAAAVSAILLLALAAVAFVQVSYWRNAETIARRTLDVTRNNYLIESNYCDYLLRLNRLDEAVEQCNSAIGHEPTLVEAYNNLGTVRLKQRKFDDARTNFLKTTQLDPNYALGYGNLAIVESNGENIERAVEYMAKAIETDRKGYFDSKRRSEGYSSLATAAMRQKRYDVGAECFKKALESAPDNGELQRNLALAYRMSGRPQEAIKLLEEVIRKNPSSAEAFNTLGTIFAEQNRKQEAIAQFQRALQINPNFAPAQTNLKKVME